MKGRKLITIRRIFSSGLTGFARNAWLSVAAVSVMVITLTIVLFSVIASATFDNTISQITDKIDISVYLKDNIAVEKKDKLISDVNNLDEVKSVVYISKDEAYQRYKEQNKDNVELLMTISQIDNPLPASLQIKPVDPNNIEPIKAFLEDSDAKALQSDPISYSGDRKKAIDKIAQAAKVFSSAGFIGVVVFAVISMMIIFNTIQMAIFNRREEIKIMSLLGANPWYIRGPFVVEAVLYGVLAGLISVFICHMLFTVSAGAFEATSLGLLDINFASTYFSSRFWNILGIQLAIGIAIGSLSSLIATYRYLRLKSSN